MRKAVKKYWGLFPIAVFALCGIAVFLIRRCANLMLRSIPWQLLVWGTSLSVFVLVIWLFLLWRARKKRRGDKGWIWYGITTGAAIVCALLMMFSLLFFSVFAYCPEHVVERNGIQMVARVNSFVNVSVHYYEYRNFLFCGAEKIGYEWYGSGGYDPFEGEGTTPN